MKENPKRTNGRLQWLGSLTINSYVTVYNRAHIHLS